MLYMNEAVSALVGQIVTFLQVRILKDESESSSFLTRILRVIRGKIIKKLSEIIVLISSHYHFFF